ncbi:MAG: HAD-IIIC family phosphatase [Candidatus Omnitrophica bacterium]|nr:HAD-IIIC family phosphatase [Candidatus Omnitrophota bacterium]
MDRRKLRALLISDFNIDILKGYLNNDEELPLLNITVAPFGQVMPILLEEKSEYWKSKYNSVIVWTQPENVIGSFKCILNYQHVPLDKVLAEVDEFSRALMNLQERVSLVFVPIWVLPTYHKGYGMLEMKDGIGIENILKQMNLRLSKNLDSATNIYLLNTQKWIEVVGKYAFDHKLWYMAKIPFGNEVFKEATQDIKSALRGINGASRKIIILDLDNTLWGAIVGEVGWENIQLGGHDYIGEAYLDFQRALKSLTNRGILLSIVSKNEESLALEAINKHPEMALRLEDFAAWKINWKDKAQNIIDLVSDLNLGLQSAVFIDDDPVERARVREALPEVFVPEWPEDKLLYKKTLLSLRCFDAPSVSKEDLERTKMYVTERERQDLKSNVGSLEDWLKVLGIKVKVEKLNDANLQRTVQLLNKTNQMNLSTRRMTESELVNWTKQDNHKFWIFRVIDKFGDAGLTGIISLQVDNKIGRVVDFVLSCRVIGRKIEETMLYKVVNYAQSIGLDKVYAKYIPTPKNKPCLELWNRSGFVYNEENNCFSWEVKKDYSLPDCIQIEKEE